MNDSPADTITIPANSNAGSELTPSIVALRDVITGKVFALKELTMRGRVAVGSSNTSDLCLDDPYISSQHCLLQCEELVVSVLDLGSKNGVFVNGVRVSRAKLRSGSELRVGQTRLTALSNETLATTRVEALLVGKAPAFRAAVELAKRVARSGEDCSVLILGETGTGKELIAQLIHETSPRALRPFVTLNCGGLTSSLIGSELFGHVRGAYTGAGTDRDGVFVQADGGTLFLDEVGELPLDQQPHLLRALECGEIRPLGSSEMRKVGVRFIAATNRLDVASRGRLRSDLYHRLATITVRLPPLRERQHDIPLLIREFARRLGGADRHVSPQTMRALQTYPWRGNVRELRHAVKRALTLSAGELTLGAFLPELGDALPQAALIANEPTERRYDDGVKQVLEAALVEYGSVRRAARALGLPKSTFADRARRFGLQTARGRRG